MFMSSCSVMKTAKVLKKGSVEEKDFFSSFNFEYEKLIKIPVNINGKTYKFIFDTGAGSSVLSESVASSLGLKPVTKTKTLDSQGNESTRSIYVIDTITIGGVQFINQPFVSADLSNISCVGSEFDGIIGSNLMSKAIWYIDNIQKNITLTNDKKKLKALPNSQVVSFKTFNSGPIQNLNPHINMEIPQFVNNKMILFDMGSAGGVKISKNMVDENATLPNLYSVGNALQGLFGRSKIDTTFYTSTNALNFGGIKIQENVEIALKNTKSANVGMQFLRNFNLILDWNLNEITFSKNTTIEKSDQLKYGFRVGVDNTTVVVNELLNQSQAQKGGLLLGDRVLQIDQINFENELNNCNSIELFENLDKNEINLKVDRNGQNLNFVITKGY